MEAKVKRARIGEEEILEELCSNWYDIMSCTLYGLSSLLYDGSGIGDREMPYTWSPFPLIARIQKALIRRKIKGAPDFSAEEFNNIGYVALMCDSSDEALTEFWSKYVDTCIKVSKYLPYKELEGMIRRFEEKLINQLGEQPSASQERFDAVFLK